MQRFTSLRPELTRMEGGWLCDLLLQRLSAIGVDDGVLPQPRRGLVTTALGQLIRLTARTLAMRTCDAAQRVEYAALARLAVRQLHEAFEGVPSRAGKARYGDARVRFGGVKPHVLTHHYVEYIEDWGAPAGWFESAMEALHKAVKSFHARTNFTDNGRSVEERLALLMLTRYVMARLHTEGGVAGGEGGEDGGRGGDGSSAGGSGGGEGVAAAARLIPLAEPLGGHAFDAILGMRGGRLQRTLAGPRRRGQGAPFLAAGASTRPLFAAAAGSEERLRAYLVQVVLWTCETDAEVRPRFAPAFSNLKDKYNANQLRQWRACDAMLCGKQPRIVIMEHSRLRVSWCPPLVGASPSSLFVATAMPYCGVDRADVVRYWLRGAAVDAQIPTEGTTRAGILRAFVTATVGASRAQAPAASQTWAVVTPLTPVGGTPLLGGVYELCSIAEQCSEGSLVLVPIDRIIKTELCMPAEGAHFRSCRFIWRGPLTGLFYG